MTKWQEVKLGDVCLFIDYRGKTPHKTSYGIPLITAKIVKNGKINPATEFISYEEYQTRMTRGIPEVGDVLITTEAPMGEVAELKDSHVAIGQRLITLRPTKNILDNRYLKYFLQSNTGQSQLKARETGTTVSGIKSAELKQILISIPPLEVQKKIAGVLSALDDKIELNNKINQNLEQQAQVLYMEALQLYKNENITVTEITKTANTGADAIQKAPIVDYNTGVRCVRVGDMSNKRSFSDWGYTKVSNEVFAQYQLKKNDIIVTRTATLGLNTIISKDLNAVYNNGLIRLSINDEKIVPLLVYRQFQTDDFKNYISKIEGETSVRPNMKINYLLQYSFPLITREQQKILENVLEPIQKKQELNIDENIRLAQLRDALLPKLMSGEIDVDNVDILRTADDD